MSLTDGTGLSAADVLALTNGNNEIILANRNGRAVRFNENTVKTFTFIDHINDGNIDLYKELVRGNYEIFRYEKYREVREENNLYVEDIEILKALLNLKTESWLK